jgi:hypothetical protein
MPLHQNQSAQDTWAQIDALAAPRRKFRTVGARWLTVAAVTGAAWLLTYWIADGLLQALATCQVVTNLEQQLSCTSVGKAPDALGILGAIAGFWFAYTGRLARLFRKV